MLKLGKEAQAYLYLPHTDMRKSINGLSALVMDEKLGELQSGDCFIFINRAKNKLKLLYWDRNGFVLHYKRLERGKFILPKRYDKQLLLSEDQLSWLLAGLNFSLMNEFNELNYAHYY